MRKVIVELGERSYSICIGYPLAEIGKEIKGLFHSKAIIVTSNRIQWLYAQTLVRSLRTAGYTPLIVAVPDGERYKKLEWVVRLYKVCVKQHMERLSPIIALGGGVVGDLTGFVAATYLRGVPFIQIPTTLLAQVDASIGGKVGVDLLEGKNLVGSFYQPRLVWADIHTLKTLSFSEWRNGFAEVIKYGVITDLDFFLYLEKNLEQLSPLFTSPTAINQYPKKDLFHQETLDILEEIVSRCAQIKAAIVSEDEREEKGKREILNFGHTFGHALEAAANYQVYKHGEAVALGMVAAARLAEKMKLFKERKRLESVIHRSGLPVKIEKNVGEKKILNGLMHDKKMRNNKLRFVLPLDIGKVVVDDVPLKLVMEVIKGMRVAK